MFIPHNCFKCNAELSVGNRGIQCHSGCYLLAFINSDYIITDYIIERFKVSEYLVYNIYENNFCKVEIFPDSHTVENPDPIVTIYDTYMSPYKINENKIKTYITFS